MSMNFKLEKDKSCFRCGSVDLAVFADHSPNGHQGGLTLIMNDKRIATNGDLRFEPTPGQWQPTPFEKGKDISAEKNEISVKLHYPNPNDNLRGFNPIIYPDVILDYSVNVTSENDSLIIKVKLDKPLPEKMEGKVFFNLELSPVHLFGKPWIMDSQTGIFPRQANGPSIEADSYLSSGIYPAGDGKASISGLLGDQTKYNPVTAGKIVAMPYASGHSFTALPDDEAHRFTITSEEEIKLYDGRITHNNGWFVLSSELPVSKSGDVLTWVLTPSLSDTWRYTPVVQTSQVGYHPSQPKFAIIELDSRDSSNERIQLYKITPGGLKLVLDKSPESAPAILRYRYLRFDFSEITEEGLYRVDYLSSKSSVFRIASDVYDRGVWQPVLEYFLPVQMCHMEVREKYRIWHGLCHMDDAYMAPTDYNHFDGYYQGSETLTKYKSGDKVPGLNVGGWHDAGDYDLRIESQAGEVYNLSITYEAFKPYSDLTAVDQKNHKVEIHQPDGKNDILEQIEHGLLSIINGYKALGRLYRGIICRDLRQYVLLGDASLMTSNSGTDARWVFTENNPHKELTVAAQLSAASRAMKDYSSELSEDALAIAKELYAVTNEQGALHPKLHAALELLITTKDNCYRSFIKEHINIIKEHFDQLGWIAVRAIPYMDDEYKQILKECCTRLAEKLIIDLASNPYGVLYKPGAWGSGWGIEAFGAHYYFLHKAFPAILPATPVYSALNFILGCHPGYNTAAYASGVGAKSATIAYGANRADYSYIPGGVSSGTELIAPDLPEYLEFPFIWQQGEYVLGGGSSNYLMLVLAVKDLTNQK